MKFTMSHYIAIHSDNIDEAAKYYETVFGLPLKEKESGTNFVDASPFTVCVTKGNAKSPAIEYVVENAAEAEKWLLKNGCRVAEKYPDGRVRYFEDRYGVLFHLWEKK